MNETIKEIMKTGSLGSGGCNPQSWLRLGMPFKEGRLHPADISWKQLGGSSVRDEEAGAAGMSGHRWMNKETAWVEIYSSCE